MTVQEKMAQLQAVKADIKQALIDKGVDMTDVLFTEYAEKLTEMSGLTPSVISALKNCRLLLPYTNDTIDNSLYSVPLSTNGAALGPDGATFADGKYVGISDAINNYLTSYNTTQPYTFEVILTLSNTSKYSYIINALTNGGSYLIVHDNKLVYRNTGNTTELISIPYTYTTKKHIALVYDGTTIKLYLDGVEKGSTKTKNTAKSDGYCLLGYSTSGYSISGVCGGVKLTSKALSPAEFSDRPMILWQNVDVESDKKGGLNIFANGFHYFAEPKILENETKTTVGIVNDKYSIKVVNTGSTSKLSCVTFNGGNKIDVTNYSLAIVYFDAKLTNTYGNFYLYVGDAQNPNNVSEGGKTSDRIQNKNNVTMSAVIDISDLTGMKYLNAYCSGYQTAMGIDIIKLVLV
jgi:hypothetical protein